MRQPLTFVVSCGNRIVYAGNGADYDYIFRADETVATVQTWRNGDMLDTVMVSSRSASVKETFRDMTGTYGMTRLQAAPSM